MVCRVSEITSQVKSSQDVLFTVRGSVKTPLIYCQIQIQIQIESLHTRLDEIDEMTSAGGNPAGPFLGARTTRAPRDAGGPPFVLSARAEPRIKGGELQ